MEKRKAGDFCWAELGSPNIDASKKFYNEIFQWKYSENATPYGSYAMFKVGDEDLGGAYEISPEMQSQGMPAVWSSYILVDDVDKMTEKAKQLGAKILREPMEVMESGKMSVFADPTGAVISLWQAKNKESKAADKNKPGVPSWYELMTTDAKKAGDFYSKLFGWSAEKAPVGSGAMEYTTFTNGGKPMAGMMEIQKEMGPIPPHWGIYFTVSDLDKTLEKAKKMGANVLYDPMKVDEVGRFTAMKDPQGVVFSVIQYQR